MEIPRNILLRGGLAALLISGSFCLCVNAHEEATSPKESSETPQADGGVSEEPGVPMRGVLNSFSGAVNDWYNSAYPQLQRLYNANFNYLPYGGSTFKFPGSSSGPQVPIPAQAPMAILPGPAGFSSGTVFQFPTMPSQRVNSTNTEPGKGSGENADAQAALATALNAFHQYVDNFINSLATKLSPYLFQYTPAGFFPFIPSAVPVPVPPVAPRIPDYILPSPLVPPRIPDYILPSPLVPPRIPDYILPSPLEPPCVPGEDGSCTFGPDVRTPPLSPPPAPEVDMTAIMELLSRFGGKLSANHILTLQPFMEQYVGRLSAKSKAAVKPLLFQYWPQLFAPTGESPPQPPVPQQPARL